jgi:hypothetical protein
VIATRLTTTMTTTATTTMMTVGPVVNATRRMPLRGGAMMQMLVVPHHEAQHHCADSGVSGGSGSQSTRHSRQIATPKGRRPCGGS